MPGLWSPWHTFTVLGVTRKVRMTRQFAGSSGGTWREYEDGQGARVQVEAQRPGERHLVREEISAWVAAQKFAGVLS